MRFVVAPDGLTARDTTTGLRWQCGQSPATMSDAAAVTYCGGLSLSGEGWRLPSGPELRGLIEASYDPAIDPVAFPGTPADLFWTLTLGPYVDTRLFVGFAFGSSSAASWDGSLYGVRCVR
jgi:hypothetical protein